MNTIKNRFMWALILSILLVNIWFYGLKPVEGNILIIFSNILPNVSALIAVICIYLTFLSLKILDETKAAWFMLLIGVFLCFIYEFVYAYYEIILKITVPFPSFADGFRLAGYVFLYAVIIYLTIGFRKAGIPVGSLNEFLSVGLLLGVIFYFLSIGLFIPIINSLELSSLEKFLSLAYPLGDLILIFLILILMQFTGLFEKGLLYKPWRYILAGFIFIAVGDVYFAYYTWHEIYTIGNITDILPNLGYLLIAMGAVTQRNIIKSI